ncbi:hypothetical protein BDQ17DRAFT_1431407 [Cyathus striatus]|nr:hypothetical protein BDQ17DRAFT_1431407 [Cyathus striatus]
MVEIPFDIIEGIIAEMASQVDKKSRFRDLCACSIICREYLNPSRKHLFEEVEIFTCYRSKDYHNILTSSPNIAGYIRTLKLRTVCQGPALQSIIGMLRNISTLMAIFSRGQDWEDMPLELKKELISAFSLPSLSVLVLGDIINFPSIILRCAVHVREVIVGRVKFSDSTEESLLRDWGIMKPTQKALRALTLYQQSLEGSQALINATCHTHAATLKACILFLIQILNW